MNSLIQQYELISELESVIPTLYNEPLLISNNTLKNMK